MKRLCPCGDGPADECVDAQPQNLGRNAFRKLGKVSTRRREPALVIKKEGSPTAPESLHFVPDVVTPALPVVIDEPEEKVKEESTQEIVTVEGDHFNFHSKLGEGSFGVIYLVEGRKGPFVGRRAALKCLSPKHRFTLLLAEREALLARQVDSPFLQNIISSFRTPTFHCLLIEYVEGEELLAFLQREMFTIEQIEVVACQLLSAIDHLHSKDLVHRDLKPENILLQMNGRIKVIDFGLMKQLAKDEITHTIVGTPDYIAPEVLLNKGYGRSCDLWSFGIILYELATGILPYMYFEELDEKHQQVMNLDEPVPKATNIPDALASLLDALLVKDFRNRLGCGDQTFAALKGHVFFRNFDQLTGPASFNYFQNVQQHRGEQVEQAPDLKIGVAVDASLATEGFPCSSTIFK